MRRLAGDDPEVNEEWITDKDRFAHRYGDGEDRLTRPLVRDGDVLRPASWPEAIDVAVRGLQAAGSSVGVLTGGRLTLEDAYGYSKFARAVLGTNNIDFRARQHSGEEADFLAHAVAGTERGVTFTDLESASFGADGLPRAGRGSRNDLPPAPQGVPQEAPHLLDPGAVREQRGSQDGRPAHRMRSR